MVKKRGFTVLEIMLIVAVVSIVVLGATGLMGSLSRSYEKTSSQLDADMSVASAIQRLSRDLQEAKQVDVLSKFKIRIYFPKVNDDGTYDRSIIDLDNPIYYYRGNQSGEEDSSGSFLIKKINSNAQRIICTDLVDLKFESTNPSMVNVSIKTVRKNIYGQVQSEMVHRAIFLRNY